nr:YdcF family protein [uncultured Gellertiella sp.]
MFLVSKLYWLVFQPLSFALILAVAGITAGRLHRVRLHVAANLLSVTVLFLTLFTTTGALLLQPLEARFSRPVLRAAPACLIVLGGGFDNEVTTTRGGYELNAAGDRYLELLRLARLYPGAKLLISGGDAHLVRHTEDDVTISLRLLAGFGIGGDRVLADRTSRNTYENAENSRKLMDSAQIRDCLLITSAFHMPRAMGMFRQVGASVIAWPVDDRTDGTTGFAVDMSDPMGHAEQMSLALREWSGLLGNYLGGRTSALYPAP